MLSIWFIMLNNLIEGLLYNSLGIDQGTLCDNFALSVTLLEDML